MKMNDNKGYGVIEIILILVLLILLVLIFRPLMISAVRKECALLSGLF